MFSSSANVGLLRGVNIKKQEAWLSFIRERDRGLEQFILDLLFSKDCKVDKNEDIQNFINLSNEQRTSLRTIVKQFLAVQRFDSRKRLSKICQPTLVITGDNDMIINSLHSEVICEAIPNAKLYIIEGGTHAMLNAKAEELAKVYIEFLNAN